MGRKGKRAAMLALAALAIGGIAGGAVAATQLFNTASGGAQTAVAVRGSDTANTSSSTVFVNVPGAVAPASVPAGASRLLRASFSAESACYGGGTGANWCSIRILVRNVATGGTLEMQPASGLDFAFDSTNNGREGPNSWEGHTVDRSLRVGGGTYQILVQEAVTSTTTIFRLDDWTLTVESNA